MTPLAEPVRRFPRGAIPTPRHKLAAATPHQVRGTPPPQVAYIPAKLDFWGNDQFGDCVSAEEAFAKATGVITGSSEVPEIFVPAATVEAWAKSGGYLNGADLTSVMDSMAKKGFVIGNQTYNDGPYTSVDYSNETVLQSALAIGPVKIGIDASALPKGAGNQQGWSSFGGSPGQYHNEDHCVALAGYGPVSWLAQQLGAQVPAGAPASGYLLYTWSTIGIVDHAWIMSTCGEAWVRNPTTVGVPPLPAPTPPVPPGPTPGPTPSPANGLSVSQPIPAGSYTTTVGGVPVAISLASALPAGAYAFDPLVPWNLGGITMAGKQLSAQQQIEFDALKPRAEAIKAGVWSCLVGLIPQFGADLPDAISAAIAIFASLASGNIFGALGAVVALVEKDAPLAKAVLGCFGVVLP